MSVNLSETPVLTTERLVLRAPKSDDWPAFRAFMREERSHFVRPGDLTEENAWRAFGHVIGHWVLRGYGQFILTAKGDDSALGAVGPWNPAGWPEPEIGWTIWSPGAEGKGFAFEAATAVQAHVRTGLGWAQPVSYIDTANARSQALARRLGCAVDASAPVPGDEAALQAWRHPAEEAA
ncbi:GNAT family N-acetyltransferase [Rhodobacter sp. NTK016B]|uniref:GNAT family N-acetyltransferase n=1 Tax=Rhodobacter sp. NTK016B TaxID=2759676 RepID=UPI001A8F9A17|nr:GNAT family N-acetyltransferase [Rhodobacter sp. NTK016B]MBN8292673.1 GNAT family N-acetyltransferase [Rhodobacter sp. NTK016B]